MKTIFRRIAIYTFILYILPWTIPGVHINGGIVTLLLGGLALALMFMILKPILNIISFPINLVTLGLFSVLTNALILYVMTRFVKDITIVPFSYQSIRYKGFTLPAVSFNQITSYIFVSFVISFIESILSSLVG